MAIAIRRSTDAPGTTGFECYVCSFFSSASSPVKVIHKFPFLQLPKIIIIFSKKYSFDHFGGSCMETTIL